jgi:hypothetical protein
VKEPKGAKLDMKIGTEYQSDLARVEDWDTSAWPNWTVTGRMLPEKCDMRVAATVSQGKGALGSFSSGWR